MIGNNIANANTVGAKVSRAEFSEIVAASTIAATGRTEGIGVGRHRVAAVHPGQRHVTGGCLDLAINGAGFFPITMPDGTAGLHPRRRVQARQGATSSPTPAPT